MASKPKKPENRNAGAEMASLAPMLAQLAQDQQAAYLSGQKKLYEYQIGRLPRDYPMVQGLVRDETNKDRQDAIGFLSNSGEAAQAAMLRGNPALAARLGQIDEMAAATGGTPEMTRLLDQEALQGLRLGGALSPEEVRQSEQGARAAFAARGLAMGKPGALAEILNRSSMSTGRLRERQGFAASREAGNRQYVQSATQIADGTNAGMKILGMPTGAAAGLGNVMGFVQGVRTPDPASIMSAGLGYVSDVNSSNFNADWTDYLGRMNRYYAGRYGGMGAAGGGGGFNAGGAAMGALGGAATGALVGSVVPGIGTAVGAVGGALIGGLGGGLGGSSGGKFM